MESQSCDDYSDNPLVGDQQYVEKVAFLEVHLLLYLGFIPGGVFDGAKVEATYTLRHLGSGRESERIVRLDSDDGRVPSFRFALDPLYGGILLYVGLEFLAAVERFRDRAKRIVGWSSEAGFDFVVYGSRIAAVQTLEDKRHIVDISTLEELPPIRQRGSYEPPTDGEGWDWEDELSPNEVRRRKRRYVENLVKWKNIVEGLGNWCPERLSLKWFEENVAPSLEAKNGLYELVDGNDPRMCLDLQSQGDPSLCVAASVQMLLNFYRYIYEQDHLAELLKITVGGASSGLFPRGEFEVVSVLEEASTGALQARMNAYPSADEFEEEIKADRPVISLISAHCRVVVGYSHADIHFNCDSAQSSLDGLVVYDPAEGGKIKFFENFYSIPLRVNFTARLKLLEPSLASDWIRRRQVEYYLEKIGLHDLRVNSRSLKIYGEAGKPVGWIIGVGTEGEHRGVVWGNKLGVKQYYPFGKDVAPGFLDPVEIAKRAAFDFAGERLTSPVLRLDGTFVKWTVNAIDKGGNVHGKVVSEVPINPNFPQ